MMALFTLKEYEALKEVGQYTRVNIQEKIIDVYEELLKNLKEEQLSKLHELKKCGFSLQYIIK